MFSMARTVSRHRTSLTLALAAVAGLASLPGRARADQFDLTLQRLVKMPMVAGAFADPSMDPAALAAYRQLMSELGVGLAPKFLSPADTIGYNGFQFDVDYSFTTISNKRCDNPGTPGQPTNQDQCPWQFGVDGGRDGAGNRTAPPDMLHTLSLTARKGIWLPLPSFEVGVGATKLLNSSIYGVHGYGKLAIHEGYHDWLWLPSLALRASVMRVLGESSVDLTMVQVDGSISKSFGVAGTVTLVPYLGAAWLLIVPRGQVIDVTPNCDAYSGRGCSNGTTGGPNSSDLNNNTVFPSSANQDIERWRFFAGLRFNYSVLMIAADFIATACGDLAGTCPSTGMHKSDVPDNSPWQFTYSMSVGFLY
jgi:hypothetical protein